MLRKRRGVSVFVSAVIYTAIITATIALMIGVGLPLIENMRDASAIEQSQQFLSQLDSVIEEVAAEGEGSARTVTLEFRRGEYVFDEKSNEIRYEITTGADVISPHTCRETGNVKLCSEADASLTREKNFDGEDCYMMENEYLQACVKRIPEDNPETLNVSDLLVYQHNKDLDANWTAPSNRTGNLSVKMLDTPSTQEGSVWTEAETGNHLGIAEVTAHVTVSNGKYEGLKYAVHYQLWSGADFLLVKVSDDA